MPHYLNHYKKTLLLYMLFSNTSKSLLKKNWQTNFQVLNIESNFARSPYDAMPGDILGVGKVAKREAYLPRTARYPCDLGNLAITRDTALRNITDRVPDSVHASDSIQLGSPSGLIIPLEERRPSHGQSQVGANAVLATRHPVAVWCNVKETGSRQPIG